MKRYYLPVEEVALREVFRIEGHYDPILLLAFYGENNAQFAAFYDKIVDSIYFMHRWAGVFKRVVRKGVYNNKIRINTLRYFIDTTDEGFKFSFTSDLEPHFILFDYFLTTHKQLSDKELACMWPEWFKENIDTKNIKEKIQFLNL